MRELSVAEQRYQAVLAVIADGLSVKQVASKVGVSRQSLHSWLVHYEAGGLEGLVDVRTGRARVRIRCRPRWRRRCCSCGVSIGSGVRGGFGTSSGAVDWCRVGVLPSESAVYRALLRAGLIEPARRHRRSERFKRWERAVSMELWQMDVVGGFPAR
jgi:Helix-turn-helix domain